MENYKPNSHRSRSEKDAEKKKIEKVVTGNVKIRKKNNLSKFANSIISEDANNVKTYILMDVIIPALKKTISDIVTDGIDMILYGGTGRSRRSSSRSDKISYDKFYDRRDDDRFSVRSRMPNRYSFNDIILDSRSEAIEVLSRMDEIISEYGIVSVADLYDLVGITGEYTDCKYGWTSIKSAEPIRTGDGGYMLKLPRALPID